MAMRAPFDNTCDIFFGPGGAIPGGLIGTFTCRLVEEDAIATVGAHAPQIPYYLTIEAHQPRGAWGNTDFSLNIDIADRVAIPHGSAVKYCVLYTDAVTWQGQTTYYRSYLVNLPAIIIIGTGGIVLNSSASISVRRRIVGMGGILLNSAATIAVIHPVIVSITGAGGIVLNSAATITIIPAGIVYIIGSGGIVLNGAADITIIIPPGTGWLDTFTDTDGTDITTHVGENTPGGYTLFAGDYTIQSNRLVTASFSSFVALFEFEPGLGDFTATMTFRVSAAAGDSVNRAFSWFFRYPDTSNFWQIFCRWAIGSDSSDGWILYSNVAGTGTFNHTGAGGFSSATDLTVTIVSTSTGIFVDFAGDTHNEVTTDLYGETHMASYFIGDEIDGVDPSIAFIEVIP